MSVDIRKSVVGVLAADATKENIKNLDLLVQSVPVYTLLYIQEKLREDEKERLTVIRPANINSDYKEKIWILGNLKPTL